MVAAENDVLPKGKVGGVGDVIRDIPLYLNKAGHKVSVVTPSYGFQHNFDYAELTHTFIVSFAGEREEVSLYRLHLCSDEQGTQYVLDHPLFANAGKGNIYCDDGSDRPFASDATKFALFSTAVCELLIQYWQDDFQVIHLHDWHSSFIAIHRALNPQYHSLKNIHCVYTVHNLALQGTRPYQGDESSFVAWFPELYIDRLLIQDPLYINCINPARAGINLSDKVHVVSPTYATEVVKPSNIDQGFIGGEGLEIDLQRAEKEGRLVGILNGCAYDYQIPPVKKQSDFFAQTQATLLPWLAKERYALSAHYIASLRLSQWQQCKVEGPLVTSVGRLTSQKVALLVEQEGGVLVLDSILTILKEYNARLLVLGSGDQALEQLFLQVMARHENFIFLNGYNDALSQQIYVQGDLFLMPSSFEPCGISQMLSMRAGQACIVHEIGGLRDTVNHNANGFCFSGINQVEQISSLKIELNNALTMFSKNKVKWEKISSSAKNMRFTWEASINEYIDKLYC